VKNRWRLEIPDVYPSANVLLRMHRNVKKFKKLKDDWAWRLVGAGSRGIPIVKRTQHRTVTVTRYSPGVIDWANAVSGADKLILDFLVKDRILVDDSPTFCTLRVLAVKSRQKKTVVEIEG